MGSVLLKRNVRLVKHVNTSGITLCNGRRTVNPKGKNVNRKLLLKVALTNK